MTKAKQHKIHPFIPLWLYKRWLIYIICECDQCNDLRVPQLLFVMWYKWNYSCNFVQQSKYHMQQTSLKPSILVLSSPSHACPTSQIKGVPCLTLDEENLCRVGVELWTRKVRWRRKGVSIMKVIEYS